VTRDEDEMVGERLLGLREEPRMCSSGLLDRSEMAMSCASLLVMPAMAMVKGMLAQIFCWCETTRRRTKLNNRVCKRGAFVLWYLRQMNVKFELGDGDEVRQRFLKCLKELPITHPRLMISRPISLSPPWQLGMSDVGNSIPESRRSDNFSAVTRPLGIPWTRLHTPLGGRLHTQQTPWGLLGDERLGITW
jgi:hypothetical protein